MRHNEDFIQAFVEATENTEPPEILRKACAISAVAAALERKCYTIWGFSSIYPNSYIVLCAPSGQARKGTSMRLIYDIIKEVPISLCADAITREALFRRLNSSCRTYVMPDGNVLNHSSLTVLSEELTTFLRYKNIDFLTNLTDLYDCKPTWEYEVKHGPSDKIVGPYLNILGATTPELLQESVPPGFIGGGFASRCLFVYAANKGKIVPLEFPTEEQARKYRTLVSDLTEINELAGQFKQSPEYLQEYQDWYIESEENPPHKGDRRFGGYCSRRATHVRKLSMLFSASRSSDMILAPEDLRRSVEFLESIEPNLPAVYSSVGAHRLFEQLRCIRDFIEQSDGPIDASDLYKRFQDMVMKDDMIRILETLCKSDVITVSYPSSGRAIIERRK